MTCFPFFVGFRGVSSGSEHASGGIHNEFEDTMNDIDLKGQIKGPYGSHTVRQVLSRNSNTPSRQMKHDSLDSENSTKVMKGAIALDDIMDGRKSDNFNSHIRYLNHLQRSADSGFASTEVEAQQARLKPLMRQTSVQENKEFDMEVAEICSSKNSSKSELNYREIADDSQVRRSGKDEVVFRDPIPEIKVQSNYSPKEQVRTNVYTIADVPEGFRDQLTEVVAKIAGKPLEQQIQQRDGISKERSVAGSDLIQSIKKDLSSASTSYKVQTMSSFPSPLAQLRQREGVQIGRSPHTRERISVDSFSDIPLPPLNMLAEKSGSQTSSPSPPLPTPPPEMLTDSEDPSFVFSSYSRGPRGDIERDIRDIPGFTKETIKDHSCTTELSQNSAVKVKKPQISRIPAISTSNSPVKTTVVSDGQTIAGNTSQSKSVKVKHPAVSILPPNDMSSKNIIPKHFPKH